MSFTSLSSLAFFERFDCSVELTRNIKYHKHSQCSFLAVHQDVKQSCNYPKEYLNEKEKRIKVLKIRNLSPHVSYIETVK